MELFLTVIIPIIIIFFVGYLLQRIRTLHIRSVATVSIYILTPALVFTSLYTATFDRNYLIVFVYMFVLFYVMVLLNKLLAKLFKWNKRTESATILATGFMNSGNYGLPVVLFSIGEAAVPVAVFIMVIQSLQNNLFGVYYASRSSSGIGRAIRNVMSMPTTYAAILAMTLNMLDIPFPQPLFDSISMVGGAAIPVMMVLLGMQIGAIKSIKSNLQVIVSGVALKMFIAPVIALIYVTVLNVDPLISLVIIIISAMPTAATTTMYAVEFDTEPELVSSITLISTLLSIVTLSILLNLLL